VYAELYVPDWLHTPGIDLSKVNEVLAGSWTEAATDYAAEWTARRSVGKKGPVGAQRHLNAVVERRFQAAGWGSYASTYTMGEFWFRVTFRHQMSAGSNFLEALKAVIRHGFDVAIIAAATREFLEDISPADAPALTSFEKLRTELDDLRGIVNVPIVVASLQPVGELSDVTRNVISHPGRQR